jgi:glutaredoxin
MVPKHVTGKDVGPIMLYALSTCGWCKKTKLLLNELGLAYDYIDVDLLEGETQNKIMAEVTRWNERRSFPTLVINNDYCINGYDEEAIRKVTSHE